MSTMMEKLQGGPEWLRAWDPENDETWNSKLAWQTLWITTFSLRGDCPGKGTQCAPPHLILNGTANSVRACLRPPAHPVDPDATGS